MSLLAIIVLHSLVVGCHSFSSRYSHIISSGRQAFTIEDHVPLQRNHRGFPTSISKLSYVPKFSSSKRITNTPLRLALFVDTLIATDITTLVPSADLTSMVISSQEQQHSLEFFWTLFWIIAGAWNIVISSVLFLQPNILNTRDGGKDNPDIQTATAVGVFGIMYSVFASEDVLRNVPWVGCIIPLAAIVKFLVTPWLYDNGCLSVASSTPTSEETPINAMDTEIDIGRRQQITPEEVNLWRFIAAGDALFALVFLYYFIQHVIPAIQRLFT